MKRSADIVIVGGGPAGACAGIRLAALGHDVVLVERSPFPRPHVGEALSPGVEAQLSFLGPRAAGALRHGARFRWSELRWRGEGWERRPSPPGAATVDRALFDLALLDAAREAGVHVLQPARARSCMRAEGGWSVELDSPEPLILGARFLIDASGRNGFLPGRRQRTGPPLFALGAYWDQDDRVPPRVAAGEGHWIWESPVPGRGRHVILFTDRAGLRRAGGDVGGFYRRTVEEAGMSGGRIRSKPLVCDAGAAHAAEAAGADYLRIGEAAFALDPLSSSGVQKAIATALQAAIVANTLLRRPADSALALRFFEDELGDTVRRHAQWTASVYADCRHKAAPFWSERSAGAAAEAPAEASVDPGAALRLADDARITDVATLAGDYVEARPALVHSGLGRPLAFVAGASLPPLLEGLAGTRGQIEARLAARLPEQASRSLVERLIACGALVDAAVPAAARRQAGPEAGRGP